MAVFDELTQRGMIAQTTHETEIRELLNNKKISFYIGFDATADSLHVGHFLQLMIMSHLQRAGHRPIAIIGGGTTMVGDPSGRTDMRQMLTIEAIDANAQKFVEQMKRFINFEDGKALMLNNADWLLNLNYIEFMREIGVHFSVNRMLTADCFKNRLERGLSFFEFNYMLMQSYDFYVLNEKHDCIMQCGGDDQWSNILGGIDLIRRKTGRQAYGLTFKLLTTSTGQKMGKTQSGAIWLDANKTSPYEFFQYWRNVDDSDVIPCMKMLTFLPVSEIESYSDCEGAELNQLKEKLAFEVTKLVHGQEEAERVQKTSHNLYNMDGAGDLSSMPSTTLNDVDFSDGIIGLLELLAKTGLASSNSEARRLIQQGGISIDDVKQSDPTAVISKENIAESGRIIIRKGKKIYHQVLLSN